MLNQIFNSPLNAEYKLTVIDVNVLYPQVSAFIIKYCDVLVPELFLESALRYFYDFDLTNPNALYVDIQQLYYEHEDGEIPCDLAFVINNFLRWLYPALRDISPHATSFILAYIDGNGRMFYYAK